LAQLGLDDLPLTNGSWIGFSVAAGECGTNVSDPYYLHKHAPPTPEGTYTAYVCDTNDFAIQIVSTNSVYPTAPYNDPLAMLGRPTLKFLNSFGAGAVHRTKIVEAPYGTTPDGSNVITEISSGGQVTVKLGRKVYDDANNPYGIDLIIFGNSFCIGHSTIGDGTDLDSDILTGGLYGHPTTVSVSQDGTNWFAFGNVATLFPDNAYRWDETNHSWTDEQLNPTKPLNPSVYAMNFSGQATANALDQFIGSAGGTGYDLKASGFPWIQYVRVEPQAGTYTVIDAIAAVNPAVVGDELSITPDNLACGITNLAFQKPADSSENLISVRFHSVSDAAKVGTVGLNDLSSLAPVIGKVSSAYQITLKPVAGDNAVTFCADVGLRAGDGYSGNGNDLRVFQWSGTNWTSRPFTFDSAGNEAVVAGVTNFSAFAVAQIIPPQLNIRPIGNGFGFQFTPVPNCAHVLERSTDLVRWTPIATNTPASSQSVTLQDAAAPADKAFYRLHLTTP
jgi:hypothetical protein